jgi:hypothetical protein
VSLAAGQSFFTPANNAVPRHLWIIVSDPSQEADRVVIVNVSTKTPPDLDPPETPVSIGPSEHPSVSQRSFIRCDEARITLAEHLEHLLANHTLSGTKAAPSLLVQKMQAALLASRHTQLDIKAILRAQGCAG